MSRPETLARWAAIPAKVRREVAGLSRGELRARGGSEGWSVAEYVHHLAEANLVASSIVLAALGRPGSEYDWSWLVPDDEWMRRLGYGRLPVGRAVRLLEASCALVAGVLRGAPGGMERPVRLRGSRGVRRRTVERLLREECEHASRHLADLRAARKAGAIASRKSRPRTGRRR